MHGLCPATSSLLSLKGDLCGFCVLLAVEVDLGARSSSSRLLTVKVIGASNSILGSVVVVDCLSRFLLVAGGEAGCVCIISSICGESS